VPVCDALTKEVGLLQEDAAGEGDAEPVLNAEEATGEALREAEPTVLRVS